MGSGAAMNADRNLLTDESPGAIACVVGCARAPPSTVGVEPVRGATSGRGSGGTQRRSAGEM